MVNSLRKLLIETICASVLALSSCAQEPQVPKMINAKTVKSAYSFPIDKCIGYLERGEGFEVNKTYKDGKEVSVYFDGASVLEVHIKPPKKAYLILKDVDYQNSKGVDYVKNNDIDKSCYTFKSPRCHHEKLIKKDFENSLKDLKVDEHYKHWEKERSNKIIQESPGFDPLELLHR